jgi:hypothetical protein
LRPQSALRFRRFLAGMQETGLAGRWKRPVALVPNRMIGAVDPHDRNADRVSATALKLSDLVSKIVDYAINLIIAFASTFTSMPISTVAIGPRATQ